MTDSDISLLSFSVYPDAVNQLDEQAIPGQFRLPLEVELAWWAWAKEMTLEDRYALGHSPAKVHLAPVMTLDQSFEYPSLMTDLYDFDAVVVPVAADTDFTREQGELSVPGEYDGIRDAAGGGHMTARLWKAVREAYGHTAVGARVSSLPSVGPTPVLTRGPGEPAIEYEAVNLNGEVIASGFYRDYVERMALDAATNRDDCARISIRARLVLVDGDRVDATTELSVIERPVTGHNVRLNITTATPNPDATVIEYRVHFPL